MFSQGTFPIHRSSPVTNLLPLLWHCEHVLILFLYIEEGRTVISIVQSRWLPFARWMEGIQERSLAAPFQ